MVFWGPIDQSTRVAFALVCLLPPALRLPLPLASEELFAPLDRFVTTALVEPPVIDALLQGGSIDRSIGRCFLVLPYYSPRCSLLPLRVATLAIFDLSPCFFT